MTTYRTRVRRAVLCQRAVISLLVILGPLCSRPATAAPQSARRAAAIERALEVSLGTKLGQCRAAPVELGPQRGSAILLVYSADADSPEKSFEQAMNDCCIKHHVAILNTGLNERDKAETRRVYRLWHDAYHCKVSWGGITHLGWDGNRPAKNRPDDLLERAFRQGIGIDGDEQLGPASQVSYLVMGLESLQEERALRWAKEHLAD